MTSRQTEVLRQALYAISQLLDDDAIECLSDEQWQNIIKAKEALLNAEDDNV